MSPRKETSTLQATGSSFNVKDEQVNAAPLRVEGEIHAAGVGQLERRGQAGLGFTNSVPIKRFVQKMQDKSVKTMNGFKELKALDVIETVS